jgi:hypothetical protein
MATVLGECATEEQRSLVRFLWEKGRNAKDVHKEMFPAYGGKCLSRKAVHNGVEKFSQGRSKVADDARSGAEVAETTVEILLLYGFRRDDTSILALMKDMWRHIFFRFEYHMF